MSKQGPHTVCHGPGFPVHPVSNLNVVSPSLCVTLIRKLLEAPYLQPITNQLTLNAWPRFSFSAWFFHISLLSSSTIALLCDFVFSLWQLLNPPPFFLSHCPSDRAWYLPACLCSFLCVFPVSLEFPVLFAHLLQFLFFIILPLDLPFLLNFKVKAHYASVSCIFVHPICCCIDVALSWSMW